MMGEKMNCIAAHSAPNNPTYQAALATSPCWNWMISFGSTGTMIPTAIMSRATVMNTKMNAAEPGARDPVDFHLLSDRGRSAQFRLAQSSQGEGML